MTAQRSFDDRPRTGDPLGPGAAPADIRAALLPGDAEAFDEAYAAELAAARESLDLTELFACLEHWRRLALLQRDPSRFASIARRAAERLTGRAVPADGLPRRVAASASDLYRLTTDEKSQPQIAALCTNGTLFR